MKKTKLINSMFICGAIFEVISIVAALLSMANWQSIAKLSYDNDFTMDGIVVSLPYGKVVFFFIELLLAVLLLSIVSKQIKKGSTTIIAEVIALVYGIGIRGFALTVSSVISGIAGARNVPNPNISPELYQLSTIANSALANWMSFIGIFSYIGIACILVGCGAAISAKQFIKRETL